MTTDFPSEIYRLVQKSKTQTLRGNELSTLIRAHFPDFAPGKYACTNLRDYIRRHVRSVVEVGRAGADIVYGLKTTDAPVPHASALPETSAEPLERIDPRVWKTFVSPSATYTIYGQPETGELRVVTYNEQMPQPPWVRVPSASPEEHLQIAKEFVTSLPERNGAFLDQSLTQPRWWLHFYANAATAGCADQWVKFRHRKLAEKFQTGLNKLGIPFRPERPQHVRQDSEVRSAKPSVSGYALLRRLAVAAIQRMPADELRSLKIPLGYIVDEIEN